MEMALLSRRIMASAGYSSKHLPVASYEAARKDGGLSVPQRPNKSFFGKNLPIFGWRVVMHLYGICKENVISHSGSLKRGVLPKSNQPI